MDIRDSENHERIVNVFINKSQLESLIENAVAARTGIAVELLRKYGKIEIEDNMEGSPSYRSGHKASLRAKIPLRVDVSE